MTEALARRMVLALMSSGFFDDIIDSAQLWTKNQPIPIHYGFTLTEIRQARKDRKVISKRYKELTMKKDFIESDIVAKLEFLAGLEEKPKGQG